ncbi:MAG TPA: cation diffusion facilitator family transporter [Gemmatimonadales bacterium]|nr:cation diffusion facilitator family transporter [Gemmatimonadales bacterium]
MAASSQSRTVIYAALIGNLLVAVTKAVAAAISGSSAMLSEAVHSFVDTGNEVLLLYGMHRAAEHADPEHPLGHGRELYFWSFIVALLIFALGAGISIYEGVNHIRHPEPITDPLVNYVVLALALLFEGTTWIIALRRFRAVKGSLGYYAAFRRSKDPPSFMVLFEDSAALAGIFLAAAGTFATVTLKAPVFDGIASILIGLVLGAVAILLARESKSLLIGERAGRGLSEAILRIAEAEPSVERVNGVLTVQLAPDQIVAALSIEFTDDVRVSELERRVTEIEHKVRAAHPEVVALFLKPQTNSRYREMVRRRLGGAASEAGTVQE